MSACVYVCVFPRWFYVLLLWIYMSWVFCCFVVSRLGCDACVGFDVGFDELGFDCGVDCCFWV